VRSAVLALAPLLSLAAAPLDSVWLASFDAAWRIIQQTYYDPAFNGVDWEGVRRELRPKAEAADSPEEVRGVIREMIRRLGESHFALLPNGTGGAAPRDLSGDPGLEVRYQDGDALVVEVPEGTPAEAAGVRPGWVIRSIDGQPLEPALAKTAGTAGPRLAPVEGWRLITERLKGPVGSSARIMFDTGGSAREVAVPRRAESGEPITIGSFPTIHVRTSARTLRASSGARVGYLRFNAWLTPVDGFVARAVDAHRNDPGLVIDLRGNPGGLAAMLMGIAGQFTNERVSLGEMRTREGTLTFFTNPRRVAPDGRTVKPFDGRVAILADQLTGSASECFAGGMQSIGRARVFGARTMGQALPALFDRLPSGDVLVHAYADFVTATGVRLEGAGVAPDVQAPWSRAALLSGRDTALDLAVEWAGKL